MGVLLSHQALHNKLAYYGIKEEIIPDIIDVIKEQKIAHGDMVIGSNYTRDQFDAVSSTFKSNPHLGLTKLSTMASEDDLRDTQRRKNK